MISIPSAYNLNPLHLVKEDGSKVRAGTDEPLGSPRDQFIHAVADEYDKGGTFIPRESGKIRLGTKYITEDEKGDSYPTLSLALWITLEANPIALDFTKN